MGRVAKLIMGACLAVTAIEPISAQSNDNDYTPLNSRIRREQKYPTELLARWRNDLDSVSRARSKAMMTQFSKCMFNRSHEGAEDFLARTDYGLNDFAKVGLTNDKALKNYGFDNCLTRVASTHDSGVLLRFSAGALRQWYLQEAYFDRYPSAPTWARDGIVIAERTYPLSEQNLGVRWAMAFADCVVAADPFTSDYFYRTAANSAEEQRALGVLSPLMSPCLPRGQQMELQIPLVRAWIGEALWHAATHSTAASG